jgi:quercetin dioxygenase-like cupin family protein
LGDSEQHTTTKDSEKLMNNQMHKPAVVQPKDGRTMLVLGQEVTVKLSSGETGGDYYIFETVVPPGARVPPHIHSREDEILEVLDGELEIFLDGETFKTSGGALAFFPRQTVHAFGNAAKTPARARFVVSPGANFEKFFGELCALPANQPPDMAKVMEIFAGYGLPIVTEPTS